MENKKVIILGSSRSKGNTANSIAAISEKHNIDVIDLNNYTISYYDYESKNLNDDFLPLIKSIIEKYISEVSKKSERDRLSDVKTVSGVFSGSYAIHPW